MILSTGTHCVGACELDGKPLGGKDPAPVSYTHLVTITTACRGQVIRKTSAGRCNRYAVEMR